MDQDEARDANGRWTGGGSGGHLNNLKAAHAAISGIKIPAQLTTLKNQYAKSGRAEGWDSPETLAIESKMLAAQRRFGAIK